MYSTNFTKPNHLINVQLKYLLCALNTFMSLYITILVLVWIVFVWISIPWDVIIYHFISIIRFFHSPVSLQTPTRFKYAQMIRDVYKYLCFMKTISRINGERYMYAILDLVISSLLGKSGNHSTLCGHVIFTSICRGKMFLLIGADGH